MGVRILKKNFYSMFMGCAKETRNYINIYSKQEKEAMIKLTRSSCLYQILQYYEYVGLIVDNYMVSSAVYFNGKNFKKKLIYVSEQGLICEEDKNILLAISKLRNRLVHEPDMSMEEKLRLETKLIEYFKEDWYLHLVKYFYERRETITKYMDLC